MHLSLRIFLSALVVLYISYLGSTLFFGIYADQSGTPVTATTDSTIRGVAGLFLTQALLLLWVIFDLEHSIIALRIFCASLVCSGFGHLISYAVFGSITSGLFIEMCFQFSAPLLLVWRHYALKLSATPDVTHAGQEPGV